MKGYKAFNRVEGSNRSGTCRGMLFEEGKEYQIEGTLKICSNGLHFCKYLVQTFEYYEFDHNSTIYAEVEATGALDTEDVLKFKYATDKLKIIRFLDSTEVDAMFSDDKQNTGNQNTGYYNTGNWNQSNKNNGFFNTEPVKEVLIFNKPCLLSVWESVNKPSFLYFNLLDSGNYKESFIVSFNTTSKSDVGLLLQLPNFDYEVFENISGITKQMINDKLQGE